MGIDELIRQAYQGNIDEQLDAVDTLAELGNKKVVGPLVHLLKQAAPELKCAICEALGGLGDTRAVPPLVSMLRDDDEAVRGEAFSSLLSIGQARAAFIPAEAIRSEDLRDPSAALTQIMWPADLEAIQLLLDALVDEDPDVRIGAVYTLGRVGVTKAFDAISEMMASDPDSDVRAAAAFALGDLRDAGDDRATQSLIDGWDWIGDQTEVAVTLVRSLADRPPKQALPVFKDALNHPDERVRQLAAMGVWQMHDPATVPILLTALTDPSLNVQRIAIGALGDLRDGSVVSALVNHATGASAAIRLILGDALSHLDGESVSDGLNQAYVSGHVEQRAATVFLMGRVGDRNGIHHALRDESPDVRKAVALAMGTIGGDEFIQPLLTFLDDEEWSVRVASAEGLKRLGNASVVRELERRQHDEHAVVRNAVRIAIEGLSR